jgi:hypothetical protein
VEGKVDLKMEVKNLKAEYKAGIVFGVSAFLMSFIVGLSFDNTVLFSFGRGLLFALVFAAMGAGAVIAIKKYVPELFASFTGTESPVETSDNVEIMGGAPVSAGIGSSAPAGIAESEAIQENASIESVNARQFEPLKDHLKNVPGEELGSKPGSLGKHVLKEKGMRYEPKLAAEAIRTLMSRDQ